MSEDNQDPQGGEKLGLSDDVSEPSAPDKAPPHPAPDLTEDVSEAVDTSPAAEGGATAAEEADDATAAGGEQSEQSPPAKAEPVSKRAKAERPASADEDPRHELRQLMELAVKYPEIGPPLAELAFKIGQAEIGERIVRMGLDDDESTGVEFYAVAVDVARREGRYEEVFSQVEDALKTFSETDDDAVTDGEANRLLHLVRSGFAVLLFDLEDVNAKPAWIETLSNQLPRLESRYANDAFYYSLLAQALWFIDRERSEATWERAVEISDSDFAWNARGTWYKDAVQDFEGAQAAYRKGLETHGNSALLLHNLAQLLTDHAESIASEDPDTARDQLREADDLVRRALREQTRRGLRRYIHGTKDRVRKLLGALPAEQHDPPNVDDVVRGRVVALAPYGAFVTISGGFKGLLHNTEIAHERVNKPDAYFKVGDAIKVKVISVEPQDDGTHRIGFSRKALLEAPAKSESRGDGANRGGGDRKGKGKGKGKGGGKRGRSRGQGRSGHRESPKNEGGIGSLGEMLLAKLEEAKGQSDE